jgi:hypothetical protein
LVPANAAQRTWGVGVEALVCNHCADTDDFNRQPIRIPLHHGAGLIALVLQNLGSIPGTHPVALEKYHHLPDFHLLGPCSADHLDALPTYPFHLHQRGHITINDVLSILSKLFDHPHGEHQAETPDEAGYEIFLHSGDNGESVATAEIIHYGGAERFWIFSLL